MGIAGRVRADELRCRRLQEVLVRLVVADEQSTKRLAPDRDGPEQEALEFLGVGAQGFLLFAIQVQICCVLQPDRSAPECTGRGRPGSRRYCRTRWATAIRSSGASMLARPPTSTIWLSGAAGGNVRLDAQADRRFVPTQPRDDAACATGSDAWQVGKARHDVPPRALQNATSCASVAMFCDFRCMATRGQNHIPTV